MNGKLSKVALAILGSAGLALAVIGIVLGGSDGGGAGSPDGAAVPSTIGSEGAPSSGHLSEQPAEMRTLVVSKGREPAPSPPGQVLHALRLKGAIPKGAVAATVVSDEECAPDAEGVSHCINRLRLAGGRVLVVRHPHRMMEVPCLSPGEHIRVRSA
jgi:hypothetical protein